ncbi:MAG: RluA family pseudouridine synthase [Bacteroidota bacterium]
MIKILYEDNHLIAVEKRIGQTVQPEPGKPESLQDEVKRYIKIKEEKPGEVYLGVIHRIDMPVSGLVLFAKSSKALTRMNEIFQKREVDKHYIVKVHNTPKMEEGVLTHWLRIDENKNITRAFDEEVTKAIKAQLEFKVLKVQGKFSWLKVKLLTGRKHQIRAQLAYIGCSIVGDVKYGAAQPNANQGICLHSFSLSFVHPVKKEPILIETPMPYFW